MFKKFSILHYFIPQQQQQLITLVDCQKEVNKNGVHICFSFQVVTLALYSYFFAAILARQIIPKEDEPDLYVPFFGILQV